MMDILHGRSRQECEVGYRVLKARRKNICARGLLFHKICKKRKEASAQNINSIL
jgi:hypothetical protein